MVRKTIIPAAGFGTRMLPAAKAVPKELLPVLDKPTLQYVVEECAAAGVDDVLLITSRDKRALEAHFERNEELEARLAASGKSALLASVIELTQRVRIHCIHQFEQLGLGHAVLQARQHVGGEPCLCLLGDTIFSGDPAPAVQLAAAHEKVGGTIIGLEKVAMEKVSRYGIVGGAFVADGLMRLDALVEKPSPQTAPSEYAIAARYILSPAIFECLAQTKPGAGGEIQLTDALRLLLEREPIHGVVLSARRHDIGNPVDWLRTNLIFASRDEATWNQLLPTLRSLIK